MIGGLVVVDDDDDDGDSRADYAGIPVSAHAMKLPRNLKEAQRSAT